MAVETQQVEIFGEDGKRKRVFETGEKATVRIFVFNYNYFPVINHETRGWLGSGCGDLHIEKKCYIPILYPYSSGWCVPTATMPDSPGSYGVGGNNVDEGDTVRYCHSVKVYTPPPSGKAKLIVNTGPSPAIVYIDNKKAGESPLKANVEPGKHKVEARKEGYKKAVKTVDVKKGDIREVKLELTPIKPARWKKGALAAVAGMGLGILGGAIKERITYGEATV